MRRVLVTGGGSGIGRAVARAFAETGDKVVIAGRRMEALKETDGGLGMDCRVADVADEQAVKALFDQPFDVVVANAGIGRAAKVANTSLELWNSTLAVTLTGVFLTFREALQDMRPGGRLIAISSVSGLHGEANVAAYSAAKHGVMGLVRSLAREVERSGITCNAVCPGWVDTPMADQAVEGVMKRFGISREAAETRVFGGSRAERLIPPRDVAAAVQYLASPGAGKVNGQGLVISGGGA
ncbi:MAG: 3-hydroxyacyl-CoA dehydrogenase [Phyllobacteriaceae bacterium]|nr:3-hydroxyacyl-CoA dehydrogenase [Phyllobacteriaceae bacterium]MBA90565.1 3-hydroxyacyl-CoA dehydrogenase [Phyllobacteriaceae bacterium]